MVRLISFSAKSSACQHAACAVSAASATPRSLQKFDKAVNQELRLPCAGKEPWCSSCCAKHHARASSATTLVGAELDAGLAEVGDLNAQASVSKVWGAVAIASEKW